MTEHPPDLRHYAQVLRRQAWLIGLVTVLALVAATVVTVLQSPMYSASMKVVVGQGGGIFQPQNGASSQTFVETMASLFKSDVVARTTIDGLGLHTTPTELLGQTNASTTPDSSVLDITYTSSRRAEAVLVLAEMGHVFTTLVQQKLGPTASTGTKVTASVFDPAHLNLGQASPHPAETLGIAGALGLAVGLVLAFVRDSLDNRIRTRDEAERWFGAPVLVELPRYVRQTLRPGASWPEPSLAAVSMLSASLQFLGEGMSGPVIAITGAGPEEGNTGLVAHLGAALAATGNRVICVDADLRRVATNPGLADVLSGRVEMSRALIKPWTQEGTNGRRKPPHGRVDLSRGRLQILPAGGSRSNPAGFLTGERVEQLVEDLRERADYVIFDTPPILDVGDAFPFVRASDSVIVVAREGQTTRETAAAVRVTLERLGVGRVGVVLAESHTAHGYGYRHRADRLPYSLVHARMKHTRRATSAVAPPK